MVILRTDLLPEGQSAYPSPVLQANCLGPITFYSYGAHLSTSPVIAVNDIGSAADFLAAIEGTIRNFNDGDLVEGTVVQVDREEVLLDIGYKTEGVILSLIHI